MNYKENEAPTHGYHNLLDNTITYQQRYYSPDSDTASSTSSIFSNDDGKSSQSSPSSSPVKSERSWNGERYQTIESDSATTTTTTTNNKNVVESSRQLPQNQRISIQIQQLVNQEPIPPPYHPPSTNPRRTQSSLQSSVVCQTANRGPPQLTRQCDRTQNFVENLVGKSCSPPIQLPPLTFPQDTSTQMIEVIWPLSISHCDKDYLGGKNLIGLRTFIQEVLKRSKTSYYTLQVALYYLVLIKPCIPKADFTKEQTEFTHAQRAMQCGRRMFLAALILASKYLQDRNYSARAWSKISGLNTSEINSNEMAFVTAVNWKLHIPEPQFQRWANIVFKYSTSQSASLSSQYRDSNRITWRQIIPRLTPELDEVDIERFSRLSLKSPPSGFISQPQSLLELPTCPMDGDKTPTPATVKLANSEFNRPPLSPRIPALPTPAMTPQLRGFCTPAARTWSHGQAMRETMQQIQQETFTSTSCDPWPKKDFLAPKKPLTRVMSNVSIISSPESMVSDISSTSSASSRTSRSSSICSIASSVGALSGCSRMNPPANHRSALASLNGSSYVPACIGRSEPHVISTENYPDNAEMDATLALLNLARTDKWSGKRELGQKRARPLSITDNNISDEVRSLLSESCNANSGYMEYTANLRDNHTARSFVLSRPGMVSNLVCSQAGARKKQRSCNQASWVSSSPSIMCMQ